MKRTIMKPIYPISFKQQTDESSLATPRGMPMTFGFYKQELHLVVAYQSSDWCQS